MMNYWKSCPKYGGNKKGGGGEDIIKLINFHLFDHFFSLHIFKVKFKLKFKDLFNYQCYLQWSRIKVWSFHP
jgi:hypothetical protein